VVTRFLNEGDYDLLTQKEAKEIFLKNFDLEKDKKNICALIKENCNKTTSIRYKCSYYLWHELSNWLRKKGYYVTDWSDSRGEYWKRSLERNFLGIEISWVI